MKNKEIIEMRNKLMAMYPTGFMRGQKIIDMPDNQIYAIYKCHLQRRIDINKPKTKSPVKQLPGQLDMFERM